MWPVASTPADLPPRAVDQQVAALASLTVIRVVVCSRMPSSRSGGDPQRLGGAPLLGDVGPGGDEVRDRAGVVDEARHAQDTSRAAAAGGEQPVLVVARELSARAAASSARTALDRLGRHQRRRSASGRSCRPRRSP